MYIYEMNSLCQLLHSLTNYYMYYTLVLVGHILFASRQKLRAAAGYPRLAASVALMDLQGRRRTCDWYESTFHSAIRWQSTALPRVTMVLLTVRG